MWIHRFSRVFFAVKYYEESDRGQTSLLYLSYGEISKNNDIMRSQTSAFYFSYKVSTVACNPDTNSLVRKLIYVTHQLPTWAWDACGWDGYSQLIEVAPWQRFNFQLFSSIISGPLIESGCLMPQVQMYAHYDFRPGTLNIMSFSL